TLVADSHRDRVWIGAGMVGGALLGVGVAALDREGAAADGDDPARGGAAVAPVDAGAVVADRFVPAPIGEACHRLSAAVGALPPHLPLRLIRLWPRRPGRCPWLYYSTLFRSSPRG